MIDWTHELSKYRFAIGHAQHKAMNEILGRHIDELKKDADIKKADEELVREKMSTIIKLKNIQEEITYCSETINNMIKLLWHNIIYKVIS